MQKRSIKNKWVLLLLSIRMKENTLKFDNIVVNKKEFFKSQQTIDLHLILLDQIVLSDKFKDNDDGFKYFVCYREGEIVKMFCIILSQMSWYIKCFENDGKKMSFLTKDDDVLDKYNEIWNSIKKTLGIKFHSMLVYNEKYMKARVREFNAVAKTNFLGDKIPKENVHYTCKACLTIDSVMRMKKMNYAQVYLEEFK